jgi:5-methylthioribose kinase
MQTLINEINAAFKISNKWHFINGCVNGTPVQIKMFVGQKETDLQIFKIGGLSFNVGFNYANKTKTKTAIIAQIEKL